MNTNLAQEHLKDAIDALEAVIPEEKHNITQETLTAWRDRDEWLEGDSFEHQLIQAHVSLKLALACLQ